MSEDTSVWRKAWSGFGKIAITILLLSLAFNVALGLSLFNRQPAYNPFAEYPEQEVLRDEEQITLRTPAGSEYRLFPTLHITPGEEIKVPVQGTKCTNTEVPFRIEGTIVYEITYPEGIVVTGPKSEGQRKPGCDNRKFDNVLPDDVVQRINEFVTTDTPVIMKIKGSETAYTADGEQGVSQSWETEEFAIVLDGPSSTTTTQPFSAE